MSFDSDTFDWDPLDGHLEALEELEKVEGGQVVQEPAGAAASGTEGNGRPVAQKGAEDGAMAEKGTKNEKGEEGDSDTEVDSEPEVPDQRIQQQQHRQQLVVKATSKDGKEPSPEAGISMEIGTLCTEVTFFFLFPHFFSLPCIHSTNVASPKLIEYKAQFEESQQKVSQQYASADVFFFFFSGARPTTLIPPPPFPSPQSY